MVCIGAGPTVQEGREFVGRSGCPPGCGRRCSAAQSRAGDLHDKLDQSGVRLRGCMRPCRCPLAFGQAEPAAVPARGKTVVDIKPDRIILIDIARAGNRLVAVGERGFALLSDDGGKTWQARETPVTRTLTGVAFAGRQASGLPWAMGPRSCAPRTAARLEPRAARGSRARIAARRRASRRRPLRGVRRLRPVFRLGGRGRTWERRTVMTEDFDRHISQVLPVGTSLLLVAESGTLARSDDGGVTWTRIDVALRGLVLRRARDARRRRPRLRHARQRLSHDRPGRDVAEGRTGTTPR